MAADNIDERREKVKLMRKSRYPHKYIAEVCSNEFNCSVSAVRADIFYLIHGCKRGTNNIQRKRIAERDNYTCQYCGRVNEERNRKFCIEHVVPARRGGPARDYNLVYACQSCNYRKGNSVWMPKDLVKATEGFKKWMRKIERMAVPKNSLKIV